MVGWEVGGVGSSSGGGGEGEEAAGEARERKRRGRRGRGSRFPDGKWAAMLAVGVGGLCGEGEECGAMWRMWKHSGRGSGVCYSKNTHNYLQQIRRIHTDVAAAQTNYSKNTHRRSRDSVPVLKPQ